MSPLRIDRGACTRFVAVCHRADALRWFRVDAILEGHADRTSTFRPRPRAEVAAFVASSVEGFREDGTPVDCSFVVRDPAGPWAGLVEHRIRVMGT